MPASSLIDALESLGIANRQQLAERLGISQASFSRLFQAQREQIVQIGRGRAVRYGLRGQLPRIALPLSLWRVGADGRISAFGELEVLRDGRFLLHDQVFDDLPWLLWDMRPQGFIGRQFARRQTALGLPDDLRVWNNEDILLALARCGEDAPGDLLLGQESLERYLQARQSLAALTRDDYPALLNAAMQGDAPGSSAGGEQPKFAVTLAEVGAVIVKFSPPAASSPAARRWADLLICEHLALTVLREHGEAAAESALVECDGRLLLETRRFDRTPTGRRALLSGTALDMEFVGVGENWRRLAAGLLRGKRIGAEDAATINRWDSFGALIGNTDRHLGNLSFLTEDYRQFKLAPAYDMLPMRWAPTAQGELIEREADIRLAMLDPLSLQWAADIAEQYWRRVLAMDSLGGRMDAMAESSLRAIGLMRQSIGGLA